VKVLLDTNIIIHREASKITNQGIGVLFYWLDKLHYTKCVHPLTSSELQRNINGATAQTMQLKLMNYQVLLTPASLHEDVSKISQKFDNVPNDFDDTRILNEVYSDRVDFLITEDKKIHLKAAELGIGGRVFRIDKFLEKVTSENPDFVDYKVLSVKKELFGNVDLKHSFFDGFRNDYVGFDKWFNSKAGNNDRAYVCYNGPELAAFLFLKVEDKPENYSEITPAFASKKRLKIGTFKVVNNGLRIGERFIKIIFDNARLYKVDDIYVTIFDKRPELLSLISLLEKFGFVYHGEKKSASGVERVYVRNFEKKPDRNNPRLTFPYISTEASVYIIPIRPEYHTNLFPDSILRTEDEDNFIEHEPHRNAISKVYVSHSLERSLVSGDVIVFYRSGGIYKGVATTIGIVEKVIIDIADENHLIEICRKRTVLTDDELRAYWNRRPGNRPFVINFLYAFSFKRRITLKEMLDRKILPNMDAVKTINQIEWESFKQLISLAGI
jgi:predicted nucleic acid-binding protein